MTKINYKSDFDFIVDAKAIDTNGSEVELGFPSYDWEIVLATGDACYNSRTYVASYKKGVATNCFNDNGKIHIICDNHKLPIGQLRMTFNSFIPNAHYTDGTQKVVADYNLDIELVLENTDVNTAEVQIFLPFFYDSAFNQAVQGGYKGTQEEYFALASQLPNAVEVANSVKGSADSLAESAEQIGGNIEALSGVVESIEKGANTIESNADTLQESANIVKTSAEQIGGNIKELKESINAIDAVHGGLESATITLTQGATKVESSATTLEGVSATISGSASSLVDSATAIAEGANTIKSSADTLQENADKVSESATKVEQAVEPLVQASESLDATKQAFEMLSSEWTDGRQAIATALTNRRYPTEPSESFHAMADKITNMSYKEGWFAKIGYTDENVSALKEMIDYSYELAKGWNPDGSTYNLFASKTNLVFFPIVETKNCTKFSGACSGCSSLLFVPSLDLSNATTLLTAFSNDSQLNYVGNLKTPKCTSFLNIFSGCNSLIRIEGLDLQGLAYNEVTFGSSANLRYIILYNIGKSYNDYKLTSAIAWGIGSEENRQSLIDSLITYSYDRASNGMSTATIQLSATTKALLTEEEIAQITNKGFTIS